MADYEQLMKLENKRKPVPSPVPHQTETPNESIDQSINQSISRLTEPSMNLSFHMSANRVMDKPRGFYITEGVNQRIDEAVRHFQEKHGLKKVDRSIVVTALLENEALWTEEALDLLLDRVINQLTKRLMNR